MGNQRNILLCICGNSLKNEVHIRYNFVITTVLAESVLFYSKRASWNSVSKEQNWNRGAYRRN